MALVVVGAAHARAREAARAAAVLAAGRRSVPPWGLLAALSRLSRQESPGRAAAAEQRGRPPPRDGALGAARSAVGRRAAMSTRSQDPAAVPLAGSSGLQQRRFTGRSADRAASPEGE
ncbi:hypothetical protein MTO96_006618 [Rhipicephalus appendiculatus]